MLTEDEMTTRLGAAFRENVPHLEYDGPVPRVRHHGALATTTSLIIGGKANWAAEIVLAITLAIAISIPID